MRLRSSLVAACAFAFVSIAGLEAFASEHDPKARARQLVYHGDDLFVGGRYGEALESYAEADAIVGVPTTRIEVAKTLAALGSFVEARRIATELVAEKPSEGEPLPFVEARGRAAGLLRDLDRRTPKLKIQVEPAASFDVRVDGRFIGDDEMKQGIALDPGTHTVVVGADGHATESRRVYLREGERRDLLVDLGPREIAISRWAIASFVLSGVALSAATVTGATSLGRQESSEDIDELEAAAVVSLAVAVGAGAAGGIIIALDETTQAEPPAQLNVGLGRVGLSW